MGLTLRYMRLEDIPQVVAIDHMSFDTPWSARTYTIEVAESNYSHMVVLEYQTVRPVHGWRRWFSGFNRLVQSTSQSQIVGYGGLWHIADEAHISTIATHPNWRGRGWGEILLAAMVRRALSLSAAYIVLEVRVSNRLAQRLYHKYEFKTVAIKPRYYSNNGEDAYDMRLDLTDSEMQQRFNQRFALLQQRHNFTDLYTTVERPKVG